MNEPELLLTDEFVSFSKIVASVHEEKKVLEDEFKKHFDEYKAKKKELENKVSAANSKWEEWKNAQLKKKKED
jgi:Skp family chaperone for outer membrane proteins